MSKFDKFLTGFRIALGALTEAQKAGVVRIKELPAIELVAGVALMTIEAVKAMPDTDGDGLPG
jgi:hypothetical protein